MRSSVEVIPLSAHSSMVERVLAGIRQHLECVVEAVEAVDHRSAAMAAKQLVEHGAVELGGVVVRDGGAVALLEVPDRIAEQVGSPRHAPFEERPAKFGEPHGRSAQEQRSGRRLSGRGEVPDVVVDVVGA